MTEQSIHIRKRDVAKYVLLPGILPRIGTIAGQGFGNLAFLIANLYRALRILPRNHPYLNPAHMGQYGILNVISEASNHLVMSRKNIDQILVFFFVLVGFVMLTLQFIVLIFSISIGSVFAAAGGPAFPTTYAGFFVTANPTEDLAFNLLDTVFGVELIFGSNAPVNTPLHQGLHAILEFYSIGLLFVAAFILIYFVIAVAAETAQSGTPFGKRFSHAWVPIRIVVFFALLLPVYSGLNGGQLIALFAAKYGSGLATNGWNYFSAFATNRTLGEPDNLVTRPNVPDMQYLSSFMYLAKTCQWLEGRANRRDIKGYVVNQPGAAGAIPFEVGTTYVQALAHANQGTIAIRFGVQDEDEFPAEPGAVYPYCGEVQIPMVDLSQPGMQIMQTGYFDVVRCLWAGAPGNADCNNYDMDRFASNFSFRYLSVRPTIPNAPLPGLNYKTEIYDGVSAYLENVLTDAIAVQSDPANWELDPLVTPMGWAGAGIWYNRIAQQNGAFMAAIGSVPIPSRVPSVMEHVRKQNFAANERMDPTDAFTPIPKEDGGEYEHDGDEQIATLLNRTYQAWLQERTDRFSTYADPSGNMFIDAINVVFGTKGLFDMCKNTNIHPLAQLSGIGRGLIDNSIRSLAGAAGFGLAGIGGKLFSPHLGMAGFTAAEFLFTVASISLMAGFLLFYIIPFLPFIYFFFALSGWIKGLFEAMVGIPLWALAHLRIEPEGLPGPAALGGYHLILEIFIRPILIVFGLLAALTIFGAIVKVLNDVFYVAVSNLGGFNVEEATNCTTASISGAPVAGSPIGSSAFFRGPVDEFFFTIVYAIVVYMTAMAAFKLIDLIPNQILRWINASVSSFGDQAGDPAEGLTKYVTIGGSFIGQRLQGAGASIMSTFR